MGCRQNAHGQCLFLALLFHQLLIGIHLGNLQRVKNVAGFVVYFQRVQVKGCFQNGHFRERYGNDFVFFIHSQGNIGEIQPCLDCHVIAENVLGVRQGNVNAKQLCLRCIFVDNGYVSFLSSQLTDVLHPLLHGLGRNALTLEERATNIETNYDQYYANSYIGRHLLMGTDKCGELAEASLQGSPHFCQRIFHGNQHSFAL